MNSNATVNVKSSNTSDIFMSSPRDKFASTEAHFLHPGMSTQVTGTAQQMASKSFSPTYMPSYSGGSINEVRASSATSSNRSTSTLGQQRQWTTANFAAEQIRNSSSRERDNNNNEQLVPGRGVDAPEVRGFSSSPAFLNTIHDVQNRLDDLARLIDTSPAGDVRWFKDTQALAAEPSRERILEGGDLCTLLILECSQPCQLEACECTASKQLANPQQTTQLTSIDEGTSGRVNYRTWSQTPEAPCTSNSRTAASYSENDQNSLAGARQHQTRHSAGSHPSRETEKELRNKHEYNERFWSTSTNETSTRSQAAGEQTYQQQHQKQQHQKQQHQKQQHQKQQQPQVEQRQAIPFDKSLQQQSNSYTKEELQVFRNSYSPISNSKPEPDSQAQAQSQSSPAMSKESDVKATQEQQTGRPNTKTVKRWNWNKQEFESTEVPDRPSFRPAAAQPGASSSSRSSADVWHQEPDNSGSGSASALDFQQLRASREVVSLDELLGVTGAGSASSVVSYEPSYLAYRVPDMDSVRGDPVYSELMLGLHRLEGGGASEPVVMSEPEVSSQRPVFGQAITPDYAEVNEYEGVEFVCRLIPISEPGMRIEWTVNGKPLQESNRFSSEHEFGVARLRIKRCEAEDSGIYQCRASNSLGEAISTASLRVHAKGSVQCESLNPAGLDKIRALEEPKAVVHVEEEPTIQAPKFVSHIQDYVEKEEGESVHFECCLLPVDDPELRTEWFFNGRPLVTGSRYHTIDDFGFIVLDIDWLFPRDTGEYVCRARNAHGQDLTRTVLRVKPAKNIILETQLENPQVIDKLRLLDYFDGPPEPEPAEEPDKPPRFVEPLSSSGAQASSQLVEGDNVHFEARVSPATDAGLSVEWFHNGRPLISGHRFRPSFDFGHIQLDILYVYAEDSGVYRCLAKNRAGELASELELRVSAKPSLVYQSQLPKEMEGGVQKIEEMEAMWNRAPDPEEEAPPDQLEEPRFVLKLKPFVAFEGSCARFCCRLVGRPRPRLTWTLNGQSVVNGSRFKLTHDGMYHLTISKCLLSDAGRLEVHAKNSLGEAYCATELQVKRKLDDYRGVLKHSPKPWYDEQSLKVYQRSREHSDEDPSADCSSPAADWAVRDPAHTRERGRDLGERVAQFPVAKRSGSARSAPGLRAGPHQALRMNVALQEASPAAEQQQSGQHLVGYMQPDTPDVNLLAERAPLLVEQGDLHPVVLEQQVVMAPAPSTIQRALSTKDSLRMPERSFKLPDSFQERRRNARLAAQPSLEAADENAFKDVHEGPDNESDGLSLSQEQRDRLRVFGNERSDETERQLYGQTGRSRREQQQIRQDQHAQYLDRLRTHEAYVAEQELVEEQQRHQQQQQQQYHQQQSHQEDEMNQDYLSVKQAFDPRLPPQSPESTIHGKEVHSRTHKQTQKERRANREIVRQIIERDIFEQEHRGKSKENVIRGSSLERRSATPESARFDSPSSQRSGTAEDQVEQKQQQQQQQQQMVYVEDHVIPPEFTLKIQPCQAVDGDEARFECAFSGDPQPSITWYRESKMIKPSNLYTIETDLQKNTSVLIIKRVAMNSNAVFTVKAENVAGSAKSSANLVVEPHPLPGVSKTGFARQVGSSSSMMSSLGYHDELSIRASSVASSEGSTAHPTDISQTATDGASSSARVVKSVRTRKLSGEEMAKIVRASPEGLIAPTFLHTIHDIQSKLGDLARLDARLIGTQPMDVRWLKDGERIRADRSHKMVLEGDLYTLLILECSLADEGSYECVASNSVGEAQCSAQLSIIDESDKNRASLTGSRTPDFMTSYSTSSSTVGAYSSASTTSGAQHQQSQTTSSFRQQTIIGEGGNANVEGHQRKYYGLSKHQYNPLMSRYTPNQDQSAQSQQQYEIPKLIKRLENQQVKEGKSITLRCQISSYPIAEVHWYKQGDKLIKPSKYFRIFKDNDETYCLKILETFPEDQGEYKCVAYATNSPVQVETKATITVIPNSPK